MGKSITIVLNHELGQQEAQRRVASALESSKKQFADRIGSASVDWKGDVADVHVTAFGQTADVTVDVQPTTVTLNLVLPWLLAAFAEKVRGYIETTGNEALRLPPPQA
jgi:transcription elongation GreA/GreB family factor